MALATMAPMVGSLCAEMVATCSFSRALSTGRDCARSASMAIFAARSRPRLMSMALAPAAMLRMPSATMAWARMVDVVVPSPTASPVRSAAPRSSCAPRFSSGSSSANSLAMVTPSLQTSGCPHFLSIRTHFDRGPSVTRTASAMAVAPRSTFSRASDRYSKCLCAMISLPLTRHCLGRRFRGGCFLNWHFAAIGLGRQRHAHLKDAVRERRLDVIRGYPLRQRHRAEELTVFTFATVNVVILFLGFALAHARELQPAVGYFDGHVLLLHPRKVDLRDQAVVFLENVHLRRPHRRLVDLQRRPANRQGVVEHPIELRSHLAEQSER